ncbi:hypothetical protein [Pararhodobacter sp.]|uniref:hypothetical protein n=1 Tax=Pararhodobacter sp. TaxID=2127056 RepID=UPI002AFEAFE6|nr:hypothetical protein [Pararhodobacter sp.]
MNRVRVVAVTAVVLGVAVVAGTQFQKSQDLAGPGSPSVASPSLASPSPASQHASVVPASPPSGVSEVQTASVVPVANTASESTAHDATLELASAERQAPTARNEGVSSLLSSVIGTESVVDRQPRTADHSAAAVTAASILPAADLVAAPQADSVTDPAQSPSVQPVVEIAPLDAELEAELAACAVWIVVTPSAGAMLDASIYAPCDRDAQVQVSHAGLNFDTRIGTDGQLALVVPALIDDATLTVTFADGRTQSDRTFVSDLAMVERVALQWNGPAELTLHAYEFGAQYGDAGHIYVGNPQSPDSNQHGFLTDLGDPTIAGGHRVQVYSYPSGQSARSGSVALEIEVPITEASCGKPLAADSIEMYGAAAARSRVIHLEMPACDGAGGYVVLPGILPDLQIAALR